MDEDDQKQLAKAKRLFEFVRPGILARLEKLDGEYLPLRKQPVATGKDTVDAVQIALRYKVRRHGGLHVNIRVTCERGPGDSWTVVHCCYHLGSTEYEDDRSMGDETVFRLCITRRYPAHFHLVGYHRYEGHGHIPTAKADPALSLEPAAFLDLVEQYLETRSVSLKVKP